MYRVLIADDEMLECRVLERIIHEHFQDMQVLAPVYTGTDLVAAAAREHPDIIIADINMPGMNGLDAIDLIHSRYPAVQVLIVTAYSRFEYAKRAVSVGASDYILKPVKEKDLCAALKKLTEAVDRKNALEEQHSMVQSLQEDYVLSAREAFLSSVLLGNTELSSINRYLRLLPHPFAGMIALCAAERGEADITGSKKGGDAARPGLNMCKDAEAAGPREADTSALRKGENANMSGLRKRFLHTLQSVCTCCGIEHDALMLICVFPPEMENHPAQEKWVSENVHYVLESDSAYQDLLVGTSSCTERPEMFHDMAMEAMREVLSALSPDRSETAAFSFGSGTVSAQAMEQEEMLSRAAGYGNPETAFAHAAERGGLKSASSQIPGRKDPETVSRWAPGQDNLEAASIQAYREGDSEAALRFACRYADHLSSRSMSLPEIKVKEIRLIHFLINFQDEKQHFHHLLAQYDYWQLIMSAEDIPKLKEALRTIFFGSASEDETAGFASRHTVKSLRYMEAHYAEEISLENVAEQNHISSFYLSRLFKQEFNYTFIEILTAIRISKAIDLAIESDLPTQEISERCGYPNISYFYKVFKKQTGITFGQLRDFTRV